MTDYLILLLMQTTVFSSVAAAIIIVIRKILWCRIMPRIGMIMWLVLFVRLVCPVFPESFTSVYNFLPIGREITYMLANDAECVSDFTAVEETAREEVNPYVIESSEPVVEDYSTSTDSSERDTVTVVEYLVGGGENEGSLARVINRVILAVYFGGAAAFIAFHLILYRRVVIKTRRDSVLCTDEEILVKYRRCAEGLGIKRIPSLRLGRCSMLSGILSPAVIYSPDTTPEETQMVFSHELNHYKNGDNITLLASTIVVCCFWYNPLVWIVRKMLREDIEVWCDLRTIENACVSPSDYARLISKSLFYPEYVMGGCCMSSAGRCIGRRLLSISHWQKNKFLSRTASVILCAVIVTACLTNPVVSENSDYSVYIENYASLSGEDVMSMHLSVKYTAADYVCQIRRIIGSECSPALAEKIGNGGFDSFLEAVSSSPYVDEKTSAAVMAISAEQNMTELDCVLINGAVVMLISDGGDLLDEGFASLPVYITDEGMAKILTSVSGEEGRKFLMCYNRGVKGANVEYSQFYTEAMLDLISSRINDPWRRNKIMGFYSEVQLDRPANFDYSRDIDELRSLLPADARDSSVYVLDPTVTWAESALLNEILGAAYAGQRDDVYYLKKCEDGCSFDAALDILKKSAYTYSDAVEAYAYIGASAYTALSPDDCAVMDANSVLRIESRAAKIGGLSFTAEDCYSVLYEENGYDSGYMVLENSDVMDETCALLNKAAFRKNPTELTLSGGEDYYGVVSYDSEEYGPALRICHELGLLQNAPGEEESFVPSERITCGEGLYRINKLVSSIVNRY